MNGTDAKTFFRKWFIDFTVYITIHSSKNESREDLPHCFIASYITNFAQSFTNNLII